MEKPPTPVSTGPLDVRSLPDDVYAFLTRLGRTLDFGPESVVLEVRYRDGDPTDLYHHHGPIPAKTMQGKPLET